MNLSTRGQARSHVLGIWIDAFTTAQAVDDALKRWSMASTCPSG